MHTTLQHPRTTWFEPTDGLARCSMVVSALGDRLQQFGARGNLSEEPSLAGAILITLPRQPFYNGMASTEGSEGTTPKVEGKGGKCPKVLTRSELSTMMKETMEELLDAKLKIVLLPSKEHGSPSAPRRVIRKRSPLRERSPASNTGSVASDGGYTKKPKGFAARLHIDPEDDLEYESTDREKGKLSGDEVETIPSPSNVDLLCSPELYHRVLV